MVIALLDVSALGLIPLQVLVAHLPSDIIKGIRVEVTFVKLLNDSNNIVRIAQGTNDHTEGAISIAVCWGALDILNRHLDVSVRPVSGLIKSVNGKQVLWTCRWG